MKRSQATIFALMGVILILATIFYTVKNENVGPFTEQPSDVDVLPIQNYFQTCLEEMLEETTYLVGLQGGYFVDDIAANVPYYLSHNEMVIPTIQQMGQEISSGLESGIEYCVLTMPFDYDVTVTGNLETKTTVAHDEVSSIISIPLAIHIGRTRYSLDSFEVSMYSPFLELYEAAVQITEYQRDQDMLCLSCIVEQFEDSDIEISLTESIDEDGAFVLYSLNQSDFVFNFAHQFDVVELDENY